MIVVAGCGRALLAAALLVLPVFWAAADETSEEVDVYSLTLEELVNIPVTSATSKQEESFLEAPGIVFYVTAHDIEMMGANDLLDLLRRLPGIESPSLYLFRNNVTSIRGQHSDTIDTRVLLLLNGRPMRETYNGGVNSAIYQGFPLSRIRWLEVIRGPGSVLHGSGAYSGVINIVTKEAEEELKVDTTVSYGSFDTKIVDASASGKAGEVAITGGLKFYTMDGWEYKTRDVANVYDETDYGEDNWTGTFNVNYKNLNFEYFESRNETDVLGTTPQWPSGEVNAHRRFFNLGYTWQHHSNWRSEFNLTHNFYDGLTTDPTNDNGSKDYMFEFTEYGKVSEQVNLLFGATRERLTWYRVNVPGDSGKDYATRAYGEAVYRPQDGVRLAAGVQYNEAPGADSNYSPRLAATFTFYENYGAKLLYGEAFRAASQLERNAQILLNNNVFFEGKDDLDPETIETFDAQLFYYNDRVFTAFTYYQSREDSTIALDFSGMPITYRNAGETRYEGLELEFRWQLYDNIHMEGSYTYQTNENEFGKKGTKLTPQYMAKLGFSYDSRTGYTLGIFNSYFDEYTTRMIEPVVYNPPNESYHHLSINFVTDLNQVFGINSKYRSTITLYGDNLLESGPQYAPDLARAEVNTFPIRSGRALYLRYQLEF